MRSSVYPSQTDPQFELLFRLNCHTVPFKNRVHRQVISVFGFTEKTKFQIDIQMAGKF